MSMSRIFEREGGVVPAAVRARMTSVPDFLKAPLPDFDSIRNNMIYDHKFGEKGADVRLVLDRTVRQYRLQFKKVGVKHAKYAVDEGRPVIVRFSLDRNQWKGFSNFFERNPKGILQPEDLDKQHVEEIGGESNANIQSHACVLVEHTPKYLKFMNSWGPDWGDCGFFRVADRQVLITPEINSSMEYFDVFWDLDDLTDLEKARFQKGGAEALAKGGKKFSHAFQRIEKVCPRCGGNSPLNHFTGTIHEAECPQCHQKFQPRSVGEELERSLFVRGLHGN